MQQKSITVTPGLRMAGWKAPDWLVSHYIVPPVKNSPPAMRPFVKILQPLVYFTYNSWSPSQQPRLHSVH